MLRTHIRNAFSTIVIFLSILVVFFILTKDTSDKDFVYFQPKTTNISFDRSQHFWNLARHTVKSHSRKMFEETLLQVGDTYRNQSITPDNAHHLHQSNLRTRPPLLTNSTGTGVSENLKIPVLIPNELKRLRPKILNDLPSKFLRSYKNPCYIKYPEERLHCLPYFFLLGTPKSGTTDIWSKIVAHPDILFSCKEPHWWTRKSYPSIPLEAYEMRYMTPPILKSTKADVKNMQRIVTGDGSASTFWDNGKWQSIYPEYEKTGPPYIMADVIHTVLPDAKLLVSLRDPTERLFSDYVFFNSASVTTLENFHKRTKTEIDKFSTCLTNRSFEACAYSTKGQLVRLKIGLYSLYLRDWLRRYPRKQLMVLKLEEWHSNCTQLLPEIFQFLEVSPLPSTQIADICKKSSRNVTSKKKQKGPMLNSTRELLRNFYRPFVVELASILNDDRFLWDYDLLT